MTADVTKRIYVGGLHPDVTEAELCERFSKYGTIQSSVDIKHKKLEGFPEKTFAYFNFLTTEDQLQKCFSLFNKAKWKGHVLKLQVAKSDFIARLKEERENNFMVPEDNKIKRKSFSTPLEGVSGVKDFVMTGAVPGTPVNEDKTWIVGKYGRVLPVVHIKNKDKSRSMTVDPSKFCHFLKKIKDDQTKDADLNTDVEHLTWELEERDTEIIRKRKGDFPKWESKVKRPKKVAESKSQEALHRDFLKRFGDKDNDFEVVSVNTSSQGRVYFSEDSSEDETDYRAMVEKNRVKSSSLKVQSSQNLSSAKDDLSKGVNSNERKTKSTEIEPENKLSDKAKTLGSGPDLKQKSNSLLVKSKDQEKDPKIVAERESARLNGVTTIKNVDTTCSNSAVNALYSKTNVLSTKPKLQPFGGTNQLYASDLLSKGSKSGYANSIENWIKKNSDSPIKSKSDNVKGSVSVATSDHVTSKTKPKLQPFGGTKQLYVGDLTSPSGIGPKAPPARSSNSKESISLSKSKGKDLKGNDVLNPEAFGHVIQDAAEVKGERSVSSDDSDNESVSSADTDVLIASAKKVKGQSGQVLFDKLLPVKNRMNDEFFCGFSDEITESTDVEMKAEGYYSDNEDDDIEDDFEKLVKSALLKNSYQTPQQSNTCKIKPDDSQQLPPSPLISKAKINLTIQSYNSNSESDSESNTENISKLKGKVLDNLSSKKDREEKERKKKEETALKVKEKSMIDLDKNKMESEKPLNVKNALQNSEDSETCKKSDKKKPDTKKVKSPEKKKEKQTETNKKRLEALKEKQKENSSQKSLISQALSAVDKGKLPNKKIVFDSDDDEEETVVPCEAVKMTVKPGASEGSSDDTDEESGDNSDDDSDDNEDESETDDSSQTGQKSLKDKDAKKLFDSSSEDGSSDEEDDKDAFRLRPQFEGEKGGKLMALQMRFGNDERFRLDERFNEDETNDPDEKDKEEEIDEKTKALKVLQEIVGSKVNLADSKEKSKSKKMFRDITALQYDPESETGKKLEIETTKAEKQKKKTPSKKKEKKEEEEDSEDPGLPEVSKERFFEVSDSLTETFKKSKQETSGFSLLAAFGGQNEDDEEDEDADLSKRDGKTITSSLKRDQLPWQRSDVVDSSDESDMETQGEEDKYIKPVIFSRAKTFFFSENDDRIADGVARFCRHGDLEEIRAKWQEKRPQLVESYRSKHKRLLRKAKALEKDRLHQKRLQRNAKSNS